MKKYCIILFSLIAFQASGQKTDSLELSDFYLDFANPEVTAFTILGIEPNKVMKPGNVKEFALGMTNYVNAKGDLKPGLAVEWAPFKTIFNDEIKRWGNKFEVKNLLISGATVSDSGLRAAWGLRWVPVDLTDPMRNKEFVQKMADRFYALDAVARIQDNAIGNAINTFNKNAMLFFITKMKVSQGKINSVYAPINIRDTKYTDSLKKYFVEKIGLYDAGIISDYLVKKVTDSLQKYAPEADLKAAEPEIKSLVGQFITLFYKISGADNFAEHFKLNILQMKKEFRKKNWNKLALGIHYGGMAYSLNSSINNLSSQYFAMGFNAGMPLWGKNIGDDKIKTFLRNNSQLILLARTQQYYQKDSMKDNTGFYGARLLFGTDETRFSVEGAYLTRNNPIATARNMQGWRYSAGMEVKIAPNYWLELAIGGQTFTDTKGIYILPSFAFRHAFGSENRILNK